MVKKTVLKLLGVIVVSLIFSILFTIFDRELDFISYFEGVTLVMWLWCVDTIC